MTNRFTYTRESLLGSDGEISIVNCIYAASKMLKGKGLTNQSINKAMDALKGLAESTGMKGMGPLVFVPVFDRELSENATGVVDLADYFNCPVLDVMMYYCYLADLEDCGFLTSENGMWSPLKRKYDRFRLSKEDYELLKEVEKKAKDASAKEKDEPEARAGEA